MALIKQKHLSLYKRYTEQLISDLGSSISIVIENGKSRCGNCGYDRVRGCSDGKYNGVGPSPFTGMICPVCNGSGEVKETIKKNIIANCKFVSFASTEEFNKKEKFGIETEMVLKVKAKIEFYDDFKNATSFIFDGETYRLKNLIKRGMKEQVVCVAFLEKDNV